ncbi:hypothetical protein [Leptospira stimsonii]|uniref:Uncharacterized protein n=1 Tax=Leptospira stimsonii TaxID=2202203 RepID=A0ABY2N991_9LEPT|nr:hypothetical protein [Leptospira stimsonii]TGK10962.1 hypothetical protein EHO98_20630 [Leptospira stimsonii]TGM18917.1 hypothetical protein EHQ90_06230 [Leptospira stimsonii]
MNFLWQDDRSGRRSDTTLRTWIVFFLVIFYLTALCVLSICFPDSLRPLHMDLIQWLILFYSAVGSLYLGKRVNEGIHSKNKIFENAFDRLNETNIQGSGENFEVGSKKL